MDLSRLSAKQLVEIDACTHCGECLLYCPVYLQKKEEEINPRGKIRAMKKFIRSQHGLWAKILGPRKLDGESLKKFSEMVYRCTLCGECAFQCPVSIDSKNLWIGLREVLVGLGHYPPVMDGLKRNLLTEHNILGQDNARRIEWVESLEGHPEHKYLKEKADVVYFVGCVGAYFPMVHKIPQSFAKIMDRAGVNFTLLGGEEWCCGFPLIGAGLRDEAEFMKQHNIEKVKEKGARSVVFACPSCHRTWGEEYATDLTLSHASEFVLDLIRKGKIAFRDETVKVTYHDPCDLGRASGIYEPPREILKAMPGVEVVELADNREHCKCCGGGGDMEIVDPELSAALALEKINQIQATGAKIVITSCQQCVRTIMTAARKKKIPIKAFNITDFVLSHMA